MSQSFSGKDCQVAIQTVDGSKVSLRKYNWQVMASVYVMNTLAISVSKHLGLLSCGDWECGDLMFA